MCNPLIPSSPDHSSPVSFPKAPSFHEIQHHSSAPLSSPYCLNTSSVCSKASVVVSEPPMTFYDKWQFKPTSHRKKNIMKYKKAAKKCRSSVTPSRRPLAPSHRPVTPTRRPLTPSCRSQSQSPNSKTKPELRIHSVEEVRVSHGPIGQVVRNMTKPSECEAQPVLHQTSGMFPADDMSKGKSCAEAISKQENMPQQNGDGGQLERNVAEGKATEQVASVRERKSPNKPLHNTTSAPDRQDSQSLENKGEERLGEEKKTDFYPHDAVKRLLTHHLSDSTAAKTRARNTVKQVLSEQHAASGKRNWSERLGSAQCVQSNVQFSVQSSSSVQNARSFPSVASCSYQYNNNNKDPHSSYRHTQSAPNRILSEAASHLQSVDSGDDMSFTNSGVKLFYGPDMQNSDEGIGTQLYPVQSPGPSQQKQSSSHRPVVPSPTTQWQAGTYNPFLQQSPPVPPRSPQGQMRTPPPSPALSTPPGPPPPPSTPQSFTPSLSSPGKLYEQLSQCMQVHSSPLNEYESEKLLQLQSLLCDHLNQSLKQQSSYTQLETCSRPMTPVQQSEHFSPQQQQRSSKRVRSVSPNPDKLYDKLSQCLYDNPPDEYESEKLLKLQSLICEHFNSALQAQSSHTQLDTCSRSGTAFQPNEHVTRQRSQRQSQAYARSQSPDPGNLYDKLSHCLHNGSPPNEYESEKLLKLQSLLNEHFNASLKSQPSYTQLENCRTPRASMQQQSGHFSPQHHHHHHHITQRSPISRHRAVSPMTLSLSNPSTCPTFPSPPDTRPITATTPPAPDNNKTVSMELLRLLTSQYMQAEKRPPAAENHIRLSNTVNLSPETAAALATRCDTKQHSSTPTSRVLTCLC